MTDVAPDYPGLIQVEEVQFKSAVSEYTAGRMAAFFNFLAIKEHSEKQFFVNGRYKARPSADGSTAFLWDASIVGVYAFNYLAGSSGATTFDIRVIDVDGTDLGSIFTTKPIINASAGNYAGVQIRTIPTLTTLFNRSGNPDPVLNPAMLDLNEGQTLWMDLNTAQVHGENCGLVIFYKPR